MERTANEDTNPAVKRQGGSLKTSLEAIRAAAGIINSITRFSLILLPFSFPAVQYVLYFYKKNWRNENFLLTIGRCPVILSTVPVRKSHRDGNVGV